ncbi:uncharacterized protein GJ701_008952 [Geothlypis trichas]
MQNKTEVTTLRWESEKKTQQHKIETTGKMSSRIRTCAVLQLMTFISAGSGLEDRHDCCLKTKAVTDTVQRMICRACSNGCSVVQPLDPFELSDASSGVSRHREMCLGEFQLLRLCMPVETVL